MSAPPLQRRRPGWPADLAIVLGLAIGWAGVVWAVTGGRRSVLYDSFRDLAWAQNMRAGRIWSDPVLPGQPYWYAPGNPLLVTLISAATGWSVIDLYGYGSFWFNGLIPLTLYFLVRVVWSRHVALLSLPAVFLGSYWWLTHALAGIPGIQGVAFDLLGLLCWHRCVSPGSRWAGPVVHRRRPWLWPGLAGVLLSACTWHHPLCGIVLAGAMLLHVLLVSALPLTGQHTPETVRAYRLSLWPPLLIAGSVAFLLTLPLILHLSQLQFRNPALVRFFASELIEPAFYAHAHAPLVVPCALLGIHQIVRASPQALWIVAYLLVGLLGQAVGYVGFAPGRDLPYLLPHEFQWHGQMALGICAAVGIWTLGRALASLLPARLVGGALTVLLGVGVCAAAVGPAVRRWDQAGQYLIDLDAILRDTHETRTWIEANTTLDATFLCTPEVGYKLVSALTGRKCIVVSPGHTNPSVDASRRAADVSALLAATDPREFHEGARVYGVTHVLFALERPEHIRRLRQRYASWPGMERAFVSTDGTAVVYRIRAP